MSSISSSNAINLNRLVWLRLIVLSGEIAAIWLTVSYLDISLPLISLSVIISLVAIASILTLLRLQMNWEVSNAELFTQFLFEVVILTFLLYFTGGSTNPFATLFLIPLTLTAATLPGVYTWLMVLLTTGCYTFLLFIYLPLFDMHGSHDHGFRLHVVGMWMGFILSAALIAGFAVRMSATVRRQDRKINELREQQLKQDQVLALGTLAAGAAHELGTPLSTMAILLKDIGPDDRLSETVLATLNEQVKRCKNILISISAAAGNVGAVSGGVVSLDHYFPALIARWKETRPEAKIKMEMQTDISAPSIVADQTLEQALLNILNNAADASPDRVEMHVQWDSTELVVNIGDRGLGLSPDAAGKAGDTIHSTKQDGLGLGLFLTYSTLERLGGEVRLFDRPEGGVMCRITLPLSALQVEGSHV